MSEEHPKERGWIGLVTTLAVLVVGLLFSWLGWMSITIIGMKSQVEMLSLQQRDVISPVVEQSLREIRQKTNEMYSQNQESIQRLLEIANQNRGDIRDAQKDVNLLRETLKTPK